MVVGGMCCFGDADMEMDRVLIRWLSFQILSVFLSL